MQSTILYTTRKERSCLIMTNDEKNEEEIMTLKNAFADAFNQFFYEAYLHFYLNPRDISLSEVSKRAYEYARNGALDRIRRKNPGKSEEEYVIILENFCIHEIVHALEDAQTKLDDFKKAAERLTKMAEKLPPIPKTKST